MEQFQEKYADKADAKEAIIGHFGLGFYSAFMVADHMDIYSWSQRKDAVPVKWTCDGSPTSRWAPSPRTTSRPSAASEDQLHGTDIVLHLGEDGTEFGEDTRISGILEKYCKFMPVPVVFGTKTEYIDDPEGAKDEEGNVKRVPVEEPRIVNDTDAIWLKSPSDLPEDQDYLDFYRTLYPMNFEEPLFQIHLNVDFPFNLTGILYFPKLKKEMDLQRNKIHLYSNQVFITDNVEYRPGLPDTAARRDRLSGHSAQRLPLLPAGGRQRQEDHRPHLQEGQRQARQDVQGRPGRLRVQVARHPGLHRVRDAHGREIL